MPTRPDGRRRWTRPSPIDNDSQMGLSLDAPTTPPTQARTLPPSTKNSKRRTFLPVEKQEQMELDLRDDWLRIDFSLEGLFGISESVAKQIRSQLDGVLCDARSSGLVEKRGGIDAICQDNRDGLRALIEAHYHDEFNLVQRGDVLRFEPVIHATEQSGDEQGVWGMAG